MFVHYYYYLLTYLRTTHYRDSYKMYCWHARLLPVPINCIITDRINIKSAWTE